MVEGARLEIVYAAMYRRFESSRFRQDLTEVKRLLVIKNNTHWRVLFLVLLNFLLNLRRKFPLFGDILDTGT